MPVTRHPVAVSKDGGPLASLPLDTALVARLRGTYEQVRGHGSRLAEVFYARLFAAAPHLRAMFRNDTEAQSRKLMDSLDAVVRNFEDPRANLANLAAMGRRHAEYGVKPGHYDLVIDLLIESMREVGGAAADPARLDEWRMALRLISNQMIGASGKPAGAP